MAKPLFIMAAVVVAVDLMVLPVAGGQGAVVMVPVKLRGMVEKLEPMVLVAAVAQLHE